MKRIQPLSFVTLILTILIFQGCIFEEIVGESTYRNEKFGVSITCPKSWRVREANYGEPKRGPLAKFYKPSLFSESSFIFFTAINSGNNGATSDSPLEAAYRLLDGYQRHSRDFHLILGPTEVVINNREFIKIEYTSHESGSEEYYFRHHDTVFRVSLRANAEGLDRHTKDLYETLGSLQTDL